jgi:hypothetical protein
MLYRSVRVGSTTLRATGRAYHAAARSPRRECPRSRPRSTRPAEGDVTLGLGDVLASARNAPRNRGHRRAQMASGLLIRQTLDADGYQRLSVALRRRRDRGDHFARIERERACSSWQSGLVSSASDTVRGRRGASRERLACVLRSARRRQPTSFSFRGIRGRVSTLANVSWTRSSASYGEPHSARAAVEHLCVVCEARRVKPVRQGARVPPRSTMPRRGR